MTGNSLLFSLPFMEAYPDYQCRQFDKVSKSWTWQACSREDICSKNIPESFWRIDYSSPNSFVNWVGPDKLDLTCTKKVFIGLIGSSYFIGFAISSVFVPRYADLYGRKKPYFISLMLNLVFTVVLFFSQSVALTIFCFLGVGFTTSGRIVVGTMMLNEFIPLKRQELVIALLLACDSVEVLCQSVFFYLVNDWEYLYLIFIIGFSVNLLFVFYLPESAKYLYAAKRFNESREVLAHIEFYNQGKDGQARARRIVFDTEYEMKHGTYGLSQSLMADISTSYEAIASQDEPSEQVEKIALKGNLEELWSIRILR